MAASVIPCARSSTLPVVSPEAYAALPENGEVRLALELLEAAQVRQEAVRFADAGRIHDSRELLRQRSARLSSMPASPALTSELQELSQLEQGFATDPALARKRATSQSYNRRNSKPPR